MKLEGTASLGSETRPSNKPKLVTAEPTQTENIYTGMKPEMTSFKYEAMWVDSFERYLEERAPFKSTAGFTEAK